MSKAVNYMKGEMAMWKMNVLELHLLSAREAEIRRFFEDAGMKIDDETLENDIDKNEFYVDIKSRRDVIDKLDFVSLNWQIGNRDSDEISDLLKKKELDEEWVRDALSLEYSVVKFRMNKLLDEMPSIAREFIKLHPIQIKKTSDTMVALSALG